MWLVNTVAVTVLTTSKMQSQALPGFSSLAVHFSYCLQVTKSLAGPGNKPSIHSHILWTTLLTSSNILNCINVLAHNLHYSYTQITSAAGQTLLELDLSNCLSLTDECCASIARNCKVLEVLGLTNLKELRGTDLCKFFHDDRAKQFRAIMLSGSKNIRYLLDKW